MGVRPVQTSFQSPWQNGVAERWVGICRRELLDHVIVLNETHLRRLLGEFLAYYHSDRTHLSLGKDPPTARAVCLPTSAGATVACLSVSAACTIATSGRTPIDARWNLGERQDDILARPSSRPPADRSALSELAHRPQYGPRIRVYPSPLLGLRCFGLPAELIDLRARTGFPGTA